jgi:O-antigen biosynthesis protein
VVREIPDQGGVGHGEGPEAASADAVTGDSFHDHLGVSVVVCAHTELRWNQTLAAVRSVLDQRPRPAQVLLVVDHNADLAARARRELAGVTVLESNGPKGLSGARNSGLQAATQPITVFLDDDAEARPGWLVTLVEPLSRPDVVATGGSVHPRWSSLRPRWLPPTFEWVVGCSYLGLPDSVGPVRNPIGANMSMRTKLALDVGGFNASLGRRANGSQGCEETELAIRLTASGPESIVLYVPDAAVDHHVGGDRLTRDYFIRRCWHEGISKATVVRLAGSSAGLERERRHVARVLPTEFGRDLRRFVKGGDVGAFMRMGATVAGLATATAGYLTGHLHQARAAVSYQELRQRLTQVWPKPLGGRRP